MNERKEHDHVEVRVITTAGTFPGTGYDRLPATQPVRVVLKRAADELQLVDTTNWIARANGVDVQPDRSYEENGLVGRVDLDYGPPERGGGCLA